MQICLCDIYNFLLFHANILQLSSTFGNFLYYFWDKHIDPVPVPICCTFFVSQNIHTKRNPNGIKTDGAYFGNIWKIPEEKSTRDGARGGHEAGGAPPTLVSPP